MLLAERPGARPVRLAARAPRAPRAARRRLRRRAAHRVQPAAHVARALHHKRNTTLSWDKFMYILRKVQCRIYHKPGAADFRERQINFNMRLT